jgi:hypothetical protein
MTRRSPTSTETTKASADSKVQAGRLLRSSLWLSQLLLTAVYLPAGLMKLLAPVNTVATQIPWSAEVPEQFLRTIGVIDIAAGLGILLPALLRLYPRLTLVAAAGSMLLQLCAMAFHSYRAEWMVLPMNLSILGLSWWVLYGRLNRAPIISR